MDYTIHTLNGSNVPLLAGEADQTRLQQFKEWEKAHPWAKELGTAAYQIFTRWLEKKTTPSGTIKYTNTSGGVSETPPMNPPVPPVPPPKSNTTRNILIGVGLLGITSVSILALRKKKKQ
jgi:hypothetical protein